MKLINKNLSLFCISIFIFFPILSEEKENNKKSIAFIVQNGPNYFLNSNFFPNTVIQSGNISSIGIGFSYQMMNTILIGSRFFYQSVRNKEDYGISVQPYSINTKVNNKIEFLIKYVFFEDTKNIFYIPFKISSPIKMSIDYERKYQLIDTINGFNILDSYSQEYKTNIIPSFGLGGSFFKNENFEFGVELYISKYQINSKSNDVNTRVNYSRAISIIDLLIIKELSKNNSSLKLNSENEVSIFTKYKF